jgi:YYY domain-containing protein
VLEALGFFALLEAAGLAAAPLAVLVLGRLPGAGLGFAKVLGVLLVGWLAWMAASLGVAPYGRATLIGAFAVVAVAGALAALRRRRLRRRVVEEGGGAIRRWRRSRLAAQVLPEDDPARRRLWLGSELVSAVAFAAMALLVAYAPDVWNTEKPMDMAIMNAIQASSSFPPHDPWMAGETLNYYYLGHLLLATPAHALGLQPTVGYNLALAALFALSASAVFTLGGTLWAASGIRTTGGPVGAGLAAVGLALVLGNLAGVREWLEPGDYDWFAVSRVIEGTINEIPSFSFTLGDLHAHVLAIPFTLLALAFALQVALAGPRGDVAWRSVAEALAAALSVGVMYAINSWSYPVVAGLLVAAVVVWMRDPVASAGRRAYGVVWTTLVVLGGIVLTLPFWLDFDAAARGIGLVTEHDSFAHWAGDQALIYGIVAWIAAAAYASRVLATERPLRTALWSAVAGAFVLSLLAPVELSGIAALLVATGVAIHALLSRRLRAAERFLWVLVAGAAGCLLLPELIYVRDEFDGSELYRMNTVFKMGYQAYLLLGIAGACAIPWAGRWLPRRAWAGWATVTTILVLLGLVFPYAGNYARRDGFSRSPTLDGLRWLRASAPGDVEAIAWLRANAADDAVVLEAVGPDYSGFGHARISTFTGRATVLGWAGHEVQWKHDPGTREADVRALYTGTDALAAGRLLALYGVDYVVAGPIERADYGKDGLAKWDDLGRRVFDRDGTTVWLLG